MSSKIESLVENIFEMRDEPAARAEDAADTSLPVVKNKAKLAPAPAPEKPKDDKKDRARWEAMNKARGINRPYKPTLEQSREQLKNAIKKAVIEGNAVNKAKKNAFMQRAGADHAYKDDKEAEVARGRYHNSMAQGTHDNTLGHMKKHRRNKKYSQDMLKKAVIEAFEKPDKPDNFYDTGTKLAYQQAINKGLEKEGKTKATIDRAGGDGGEFKKIQKAKDIQKAKNMKPVHYQKDSDGNDTKRRDNKAGPKGHSAANTFNQKGTATADRDDKTAPMSKDAINQSGVRGHSVSKDGKKIPSERWSMLKGALAKRKTSNISKTAPDVN